MNNHIIALAALAAFGFAGGAYAEDATKAVGPKAMSDAEMDQVAAGMTIRNHGRGTVDNSPSFPDQGFRGWRGVVPNISSPNYATASD